MAKKSEYIHGTGPSDRGKRWFLDVRENWSDLWPGFHRNWRNFTVIKLEGEIEHITGRAQLDIAVLGLGVTITYVYNPETTAMINAMSKRDQILEMFKAETGNPDIKIHDPDGWLRTLDEDEDDSR